MKASKLAYNTIKRYESYSPKPYLCPAGYNTIGYGHLIPANVNYNFVSIETANQLLQSDIEIVEKALNKLIDIPITQNQFDALISLVFNWGVGNFEKSEGLKLLNQGKFDECAKEFFSIEEGVVNIKGKKSQGLINRRIFELKIWNTK